MPGLNEADTCGVYDTPAFRALRHHFRLKNYAALVAEIDPLTNKTAIKEYHDHDFNHLIDVLKKNKSKLSVDPSNRKTQELLEDHFTKSVTVLEPFKGKIQATDNLIDQIVYTLYGLCSPRRLRLWRGEHKTQ